VKLAELSASRCSKTMEGLVLEHKEEGSSELRRSFVMCGVRVLRLCPCNQLTEDNKEEDLVDVALGWG
jgi:hypothetical protein